VSSGGSFGCPGGLVVAGGVEGQFAQELAGGGVDDPDVQVVGQEQDVGSGVGPADADVVEAAAGAQGDGAGGADDVAADPVVGVAGAVPGDGFGPGAVDGGWGGPVGQGAVRPLLVVLVREGVQQLLKGGQGGGPGAISSWSAGTAQPCPGSGGGSGGRSSG
jgi:hypothetical protein